jgi:pyruvate dehydrogenase E2 component (dihydrolipoamide acetyltransferase)
MAEEIRFPRLGWSMEEGRFVQWLKRDGDLVREGDILFEMEGEKALQEIESVGNGILKIAADAPQPDEVVQVGRLLGYLLLPNEKVPTDGSPSQPTDLTNVQPKEDEQGPQETEPSESSIIERRDIATPRARRLAQETGVVWNELTGSGRDGRIRESDVRQAAEAISASSVREPQTGANRFTPRRKMIAERLRKSREHTIPVTLTTQVDVSKLVAYREMQKKMQNLRVPAFTDLFAKHAAIVLARHPAMSVRWNQAHTELHDVPASQFHIGIAVDTADGLLVPVIRDVSTRSLDEIVIQSKALIEKARTGRLTKEEMSGGVLSITNLGSFGIDAFTPIINVPEIAILGLGAIRREPTYDAHGQVKAVDRMVLSLTFDHAAVDGAPAAAFLKDLVSEIESVD